MTGLSFDEQNNWRIDIENRLKRCECDYKIKCINPVKYYNFEFDLYDNEREIMEFDLYKLRHSDLVIVNFNNPESKGTTAEISIAYDRRIPIIGLNEKESLLYPWDRDMCSKIFTDINKMIDYVIEDYLN